MRPESEPPRESSEAPQEPYEPPLAEDLEASEGTVAACSGGTATPPGDAGQDDLTR